MNPGLIRREALIERLRRGSRSGVTVLSAPAGSGKSSLLRSWSEGEERCVALVSVGRGEQDAHRFWTSILDAVRRSDDNGDAGPAVVSSSSSEADSAYEQLLSVLLDREDELVLAVDDLHELDCAEALEQLDDLLAALPPSLHVVLASRVEPSLRLHRLRLDGRLTEIRGADLHFDFAEASELLAASGVELSEAGLTRLHEQTEGWAAGLRLAALALNECADPEEFVAAFSGSERTVSEYLLAEALNHQPDHVRDLLLRVSIAEQVSGELAELLVGQRGGQATLRELENANAFVVSVDPERRTFRLHHLFADFLRLELAQAVDPDEVRRLHRTASRWFEEQGRIVEAIRHSQEAGDWRRASELLSDHALGMALDGEEATVRSLLAAFPRNAHEDDAELAVVLAVDQLAAGSLDDAQAYLGLAEANAERVPSERRRRLRVSLAATRLSLARRRGDFTDVLEQIEFLASTPAAADELPEIGLSSDLRAFALLNLGIVETWSLRLLEGEGHLEEAAELARRIGRPHLEVTALSHLGFASHAHSFARVEERCRAAIERTEELGWLGEAVAAPALTARGGAMLWLGRIEEGVGWLDRAALALHPEVEPATGLLMRLARALAALFRGYHDEAAAHLRAAEAMQTLMVGQHGLAVQVRGFRVTALARAGRMEEARAALDAVPEHDLAWGESGNARGQMKLAEGDPQGALDAVAQVRDGSLRAIYDFTVIEAELIAATALVELDRRAESEAAIERALALAEPDGLIFPFAMTPVLALLQRHPGHDTAHASLLAQITDCLSGARPAAAVPTLAPGERLSPSESRVLGYLPTNLSAPEIASELYLSVNTVKSHMRRIYEKLAAHNRKQAVARARELGLLAGPARHA
jgi:LuxR family transcriptional regulator, maltose regulon positive regulatory protein